MFLATYFCRDKIVFIILCRDKNYAVAANDRTELFLKLHGVYVSWTALHFSTLHIKGGSKGGNIKGPIDKSGIEISTPAGCLNQIIETQIDV